MSRTLIASDKFIMTHHSNSNSLQGDYNQYECGLTISEARAEDDGEWTCEFESYVKNGKRGDGYMTKVRWIST